MTNIIPRFRGGVRDFLSNSRNFQSYQQIAPKKFSECFKNFNDAFNFITQKKNNQNLIGLQVNQTAGLISRASNYGTEVNF